VPAPTLISYTEVADWTTIGDGNNKKSTASAVVWQSGDLLVFIGTLADSSDQEIVPDNQTGLTWVRQQSQYVLGTCAISAFSCVATSGNTALISAYMGGSSISGFGVWVFRNHGGVGNSDITSDPPQSGPKTISLANSASSSILWAAADWTAGASPAPVPSSPSHVRQQFRQTNQYSVIVADNENQNSGTVSYGMSGGSTVGPFSIVALEVKGTSSGDQVQLLGNWALF
jgi:hypothetical protein